MSINILVNSFRGFIRAVDRAVLGSTSRRALNRWQQKRRSKLHTKLLTTPTHRDLVSFEPAFGILHQLCDKWGSDKGSCPDFSNRPYWWPPHTYASVYEGLFGHCRHDVRLVFECGLGTKTTRFPNNMSETGRPGASMRVWRDFFPNAQVYGADIDRDTLFRDERIETFWVDQTDRAAIQSMWSEIGQSGFDLIIDDGLHTFAAGKTMFEGSYERLKSGGIYVIEDVSNDSLVQFQRWSREHRLPAEFHQLIRTSDPPFDNNLVIIRRSL